MNRLNSIFIYTNIFIIIFFNSCCFAVTFEEKDFEKLVLNHPMMKNYDNKTGYFNNSSYSLHDVDKLKAELKELTLKLNNLKDKNIELASQSADISEEPDEDEFWKNISVDSQEIKIIENKIFEITNLLYSNGKPDYNNLFKITSKMAKEVILPLYNKNKIILNKLPKYYFYSPSNITGLNRLFNLNNDDSLKKYITTASSFASIFPDSDKTILFNKKEVDYSEIANIDLTFAFMLHPKMAFFNFINCGFDKNGLSLLKKEIIHNKESSNISNNDKIKKLKLELDNLYSKKIYYFNNINNPALTKEASKFLNRFSNEEKRLQNEIFDCEYINSNSEFTSPKESIKIIKEIYEDIDLTINEVLKENKYKIVLNRSLPIDFGYNIKYPSVCIKGLGHAGINYILFYSFYNNNYLKGPFKDLKNDVFQNRRLKLINNHKGTNIYILSLKPYPIFLSGGNSILSEVTKKLYAKYNIDTSANTVLDSVISKIEAYQNGFDY